MEEDSDLPPLTPAPVSGFQSGHDTTYNWSEDDIIALGTECRQVESGW